SVFLYENVLYLAYREDGAITVVKLVDGVWQPVGNRQFTISNAYDPVIYVDRGTPYVVYETAADQAVVMKFEEDEWVQVGNLLSTTSAGHFFMVVKDDIPYVAYIESPTSITGTMRVKQYIADGEHAGEWQSLGDADLFGSVVIDSMTMRQDSDRL